MATLKHNKKRNVGLVFEFLARYLGHAIIENRDKDISRARLLVQKHFNKETDLYKELKLFRALYEANTPDRAMAQTLIERVRERAAIQSQARLDLEKTSLIHEINATLGDSDFFDRDISDFRTYATIQVLLNQWRGSTLLEENISEMVQLESRLIDHITQEKKSSDTQQAPTTMTDSDVNGLVVGILAEKINQKFADVLDDKQKKLIQLYVFSGNDQNALQELNKTLTELRTSVLNLVDRADDPSLKEKLSSVKSMLLENYSDIANPTDDLVSFYMGLATLEKELATTGEKKEHVS